MIKRKNKAVLCAIASIALVSTGVTVPANAMNNDVIEAMSSKSKKEMVAKVNDLNVRTGSSTKHKVIGKLNKGDKVTVVQTLSNGWVKIEYKGGFGYVSNVKGAYLEAVSSSNPGTQKKEMVAKVNDLNVRTGSSTKHKVIGKLNKGDKVTVVQTLSNGWVKIEYKGGFGYVSNVKGAYLETASSSKPDVPSKPESTKKEMVAKVNDLNVRTGSSTKHKILGKLNKGDKVTVVQTLSNGWVKIEYKGGFGFVSNVKGAYLEPVVETQDKKDADKVIALINSLNANITLADKADVVKAREAYNALSEKAKALVTNLNKLTDAEKAIAELEKDKVDTESSQEVVTIIEDIKALNNISINDRDLIARARTAYNSLSPEAKAMVAPEILAVLEDAEEKIAKLETEVDKVKDMLTSLPSPDMVTVEHVPAINALSTAYNKLTPEQKKLAIPDEMILIEYEFACDRIEKAQPIIEMINKLPEVKAVKIADKAKVQEARKAYDDAIKGSINAGVDKYITNYKKLQDLENKIKELEAKVEEVKGMLTALPEPEKVTVEHVNAINAFSTAYNKLTPEQKKLVAPDEMVVIEYEFACDRIEKAQPVIEMINALPEVNSVKIADRPRVDSARDAYAKLDKGADKYVTNYDKLVALEKKLNELEAPAKEVKVMLEALPPFEQVTIDHVDKINAFSTAYNKLTPEQKKLVAPDEMVVIEYEFICDRIEKAQPIIEMINKLPEVDAVEVSHKAEVQKVRKAYDDATKGSVNAGVDKHVTNYKKLQDLEKRIAELEKSN